MIVANATFKLKSVICVKVSSVVQSAIVGNYTLFKCNRKGDGGGEDFLVYDPVNVYPDNPATIDMTN